jgi:hypothetical protein
MVRFLAVLALAGLCSCSEPPRADYRTWAVGYDPLPPARDVPVETELPADAFPWAGTVSHHLLADSLIDQWFHRLAQRRKVDEFWIISPSHWALSKQPVSIADGRWAVTGGWVYSDREASHRIASRLGVPFEPEVFYPEHGVSTLIPYIARYFPKAKVVAMAYHGEPPVDQPLAERIKNALAPEFTAEGRQRNFLVISADFAHHGNLAGTQAKDTRSRIWLEHPTVQDWILVGCDNRPGIYSLSHMLGPTDKISILFHTNSWFLSGQEPNNITSYFFSYAWTPMPKAP